MNRVRVLRSKAWCLSRGLAFAAPARVLGEVEAVLPGVPADFMPRGAWVTCHSRPAPLPPTPGQWCGGTTLVSGLWVKMCLGRLWSERLGGRLSSVPLCLRVQSLPIPLRGMLREGKALLMVGGAKPTRDCWKPWAFQALPLLRRCPGWRVPSSRSAAVNRNPVLFTRCEWRRLKPGRGYE